jgi:diguanylate cyclase (GGDEF)-like protein
MGRRDLWLIVGLLIATVVVFSRPIMRLLDVAREVEQAYGLGLIPGLIILTVVFAFHLQDKRMANRTEIAAAEATARLAQERSRDLERLVTFGQSLTRSLDLDAIRETVTTHLSELAQTDEAWVMIRSGDHWALLAGASPESRTTDARARERLADHALALESDKRQHSGGIDWEGQVCFPMIAAGTAVGVMGLPEDTGEFTESRRRMLAAAAALLAVSVKNAQLFREVRDNSLRDGLTGCFNRTHALEVIDTELRRARRSHQRLSVIMFDIDHFKAINDRYGHLCGDAVLAMVGRKMRDVLRGSDMKCRYGGEEFLVLLPETPVAGAEHVAETLRRELAETPVAWSGQVVELTASFGIAVALPSEVESKALIARADGALYRAKNEGRNCIRVASNPVLV